MRAALFLSIFIMLAGVSHSPPLKAQTGVLQDQPSFKAVSPTTSNLPLDAKQLVELERALERRDYKKAETILVAEVERDPKSARASRLLLAAGSVFFLDEDYLNAAIAYKKAEAMAPLDERSRFTLSMAYIRLGRREWARPELEKLVAANPQSSLYLYWLARLDYDAQQYAAAISRFERVIELDPQMMRAFDSLGLCYDYLGRYDEAIKNFSRATELNRQQARPSPWPHLDFAIALISVNRLGQAENELREALRYDDRLPQAHYQLGQVLEKMGKSGEAVESLLKAVALDPVYPEPHYTLGRIYQKLGKTEEAKASILRFQQLKAEGKNNSKE
jgi:tetratricopeptide (TPR) repeat protein